MSEFNQEQHRGYREKRPTRAERRRELRGGGDPSPLKDEKLSKRGESRRHFLVQLGVAGLATGAAGLGIWRPWEEGGNDEAKYYQTRLAELDEKIVDVTSFEEVAPQVGELAVEYFSKEMGYDATRYQGKLHFLRNSDFIKRRQEISGCIEIQTKEDEFAFVNVSSQDMIFNLSLHLVFNARNNKLISTDHAQQLFAAVLHELHHVSAPITQQVDTTIPVRWRGLGFLEPKPEQAKPGDMCYDPVRVPLEEAIVTDSTNFMLKRLGLTDIVLRPSERYRKWTEKYRKMVIDKFFGG